MSVFLLLHLLIIIFLQLLGFFVYKKYKNTSGIFFLMFCILYGFWYLLYTIIYSSIFGGFVILNLIRLMYAMSLIAIYNMLFFVLFFNNNIKNIKKINNVILLIFIFLFVSIVFTPYFIENVSYISEKNYFLENYGFLYIFLAGLYILYIPLFFIVSYFKIKHLSYINKMRLKYICIGFFVSTILSNIFLTILPFFGKFYFIEDIIFFILPFLFSTFYSIHTYNFSDFNIRIGKFLVMFFASFGSITIVNIIREFYQNFGNKFIELWKLNKNFGILDFLLVIFFFIILYKYLTKKLLGNNKFDKIENLLFNIKKEISFISSFDKLNIYLKRKLKSTFGINYGNIKLFKENDKSNELYKFFNKDLSRDLFINDIVFIQENKYKFNIKKIYKELSKDCYLIFPLINNKQELIGIFELGYKPFKESYYSEGIKIIKDFVTYITGHLRYINIYSKINDLNINLDKKVDEKTIEYNNLLNKQREFISVSSHEIKTPIASTIFQTDCLIDDIKSKRFNKKYFEKELKILNEQLLKIGNLVNKIFKVQKYDIKDIKLFIEKINIKLLLLTEIEGFKKANPNVKINLKIDKNLLYMDLDKVQFTQVIDNILNNAVKFSNKNSQIINIKIFEKNDFIYFNIEDNGKGFKGVDIKSIFDKYVTGDISSMGLGLGLYLCKKIIKMHNGEIYVENSKILGGAKFIIKIPKILNYKKIVC